MQATQLPPRMRMLIVIRQAGATPARRRGHGAVGLARDADEAVDAKGDGGQHDKEDNDDDGDDVVSLHFGRFVFCVGISSLEGLPLLLSCCVDSSGLWCWRWAWWLGLPAPEFGSCCRLCVNSPDEMR